MRINKNILKYFGIPENKSENIKSISDYLNLILFQSLRQVLYLKLLIFLLFLPEKIKFISNYNNGNWIIMGQNRKDMKSITIEFE
jgi:hypothetical protein